MHSTKDNSARVAPPGDAPWERSGDDTTDRLDSMAAELSAQVHSDMLAVLSGKKQQTDGLVEWAQAIQPLTADELWDVLTQSADHTRLAPLLTGQPSEACDAARKYADELIRAFARKTAEHLAETNLAEIE